MATSRYIAPVLALALAAAPTLAQPLPEATPEAVPAELVAPLSPEAWFPVPVEKRLPPFNPQGTFTRVDYVPVDGANRPWRLCASLPGLQYEYIRAIAHGLDKEAQRQGVELRLHDAGALDAESQRKDIEACLEDGVDAVLVLAAERGALNEVLRQASGDGVIVVDVGTNSGSSDVTARITGDTIHLGHMVGSYLVERHPVGSDTARVAWVPGPADATFAQEYDVGFRDGIRDGAIELARTEYTDLDDASLRSLMQDVHEDIADLHALAGISAAMLVAADEFESSDHDVVLVSTNLSAEVITAIESGAITAAINDRPVAQGRIAVDIAVRALEGLPFIAEMRPALEMVGAGNVATFDRSLTLAPATD